MYLLLWYLLVTNTFSHMKNCLDPCCFLPSILSVHFSTDQGQMSSSGLRIIFLDVDGVLCNSRSLLLEFDDEDTSLIHDPQNKISPIELSCILNLKNIIDTTGGFPSLFKLLRLIICSKNCSFFIMEA